MRDGVARGQDCLSVRADVERSAEVVLEVRRSGIALHVQLPDGRAASREVMQEADVLPTLEALLLLPGERAPDSRRARRRRRRFVSAATCPRSFEAEALRDSRLGGDERAAFERHAASCPACRRELRTLEDLAESVRAPVPGEEKIDELHVRRERTRLLAAFDGQQIAPERDGSRVWAVAVALAAVFVAGILALWPRPAPPPLVEKASPASIHAENPSVWSEGVEGNLERITLTRGSLRIHVDHAVTPGRVLVMLPDGELEDVGTTFIVSAEGGRTTRVVVEEGRVILRVHGEPAVTVAAGATWIGDAPVAAAPSEPSRAGVETPPRTRPNAALETLPSATASAPSESRKGAALRAPVSLSASAPPRASSRAEAEDLPQAPDPAAEFRAALAALHGGDHVRSASAFARFLSQHPGDVRAEDAAYLRVIALQRAGNAAATTRAASDYLSRFPSGFRRPDVEAVLRAQGSAR